VSHRGAEKILEFGKPLIHGCKWLEEREVHLAVLERIRR
jgi:hypothetical protein